MIVSGLTKYGKWDRKHIIQYITLTYQLGDAQPIFGSLEPFCHRPVKLKLFIVFIVSYIRLHKKLPTGLQSVAVRTWRTLVAVFLLLLIQSTLMRLSRVLVILHQILLCSRQLSPYSACISLVRFGRDGEIRKIWKR